MILLKTTNMACAEGNRQFRKTRVSFKLHVYKCTASQRTHTYINDCFQSHISIGLIRNHSEEKIERYGSVTRARFLQRPVNYNQLVVLTCRASDPKHLMEGMAWTVLAKVLTDPLAELSAESMLFPGINLPCTFQVFHGVFQLMQRPHEKSLA